MRNRFKITVGFVWLLGMAAGTAAPAGAEDRAERVRKDKDDILAGGRWFYNDLEKGLAAARVTGKPLLVVLRCIPCEACRGFDEQVAGFDKRIQELLDRFVRVRIPQANGLDLSLFQFDYDLSFYAFFLNADRAVYGRFGTRSTQEDKSGAVSIEAFREALEAVLKLHEKYPDVKDSQRMPASGKGISSFPSMAATAGCGKPTSSLTRCRPKSPATASGSPSCAARKKKNWASSSSNNGLFRLKMFRATARSCYNH
jgi:hypothetical protein